MPTSTVDETRERESVPRPAVAAPSRPQWAPGPVERRRRRRRRSRVRSTLRWSLRILATLIVAGVLLVLFQGTAYSDTPEAAGAKRPGSIQEWVEQLARNKAGRDQETGSEKQAEAPERSPTIKPAAVDPKPTDGQTTEPTPTEPRNRITPDPKPTDTARDNERVNPTIPPRRRAAAAMTPAQLAPIDFAGSVQPLSEIPADDPPWTETLQLVFALEKEFADHAPVMHLGVLRGEIYGHLIALSVTIDHNDNPRENLDELRAYLEKVLGLHGTRQTEANIERLLPRSVLPNRRGSPVGVALIALVLSDLVSQYLELEPVLAGDQIGLRYRSGMHRYTLIPTALDRLYSDRDFLRWATGEAEPNDQRIRVLTRREFWGIVMAEAGAALLTEGHTARAARMLSRSIDLFPDHALPHIASARILVSRNDIESARDELDLAVKLEPHNAAARFERAAILETIGDLDALEKDLRWLTHQAKSPLAAVKLVNYYLDRSLFRDAEREFRSLEKHDLPPSMKKELAKLELAVGAAPWVARLLHSASAADRFEAIDALAGFPTRATLQALIATLDDQNMKLGNYAYKALRELSNMDIPKDAARWSTALERLPRE